MEWKKMKEEEEKMDLILEKPSKRSIQKTLDSVKENLAEAGYGVLWELNFKRKLAEKELEYPYDYWILKEEQRVGYFLPCKIVVYDSEGGTRIGFAKPSAFIGSVSDSELIRDLALEVENELIAVIGKSIK